MWTITGWILLERAIRYGFILGFTPCQPSRNYLRHPFRFSALMLPNNYSRWAVRWGALTHWVRKGVMHYSTLPRVSGVYVACTCIPLNLIMLLLVQLPETEWWYTASWICIVCLSFKNDLAHTPTWTSYQTNLKWFIPNQTTLFTSGDAASIYHRKLKATTIRRSLQ